MTNGNRWDADRVSKVLGRLGSAIALVLATAVFFADLLAPIEGIE